MDVAVSARSVAPPRVGRSLDGTALAVPLFAAAMLLSGFLVFLVEPMMARMVLPILGGVPMVWNGCVVFFQIAMLAGYGYAFAASRWLPLRRHVPLHVMLLAAPALVLPVVIQPGSIAPPQGNPVPWLLAMLAATIGLPFFVLSTSAAVLQHWLSRTEHPAGRDPYFLYAASNAGCLIALASYPLVFERVFTLSEQARLWAAGYGLFAGLAACCGLYAWRHASRPVQGGVLRGQRLLSAAPPLSLARRARWVALAFVPPSLMLAVTTYVSTDIASVPLLWIVPLALYLATFAAAFGRHAGRYRALAARALPLLVVPLAIFMLAQVREPLLPILLLHLGAFATISLECHGNLSADRPDASHLTQFYFWLSFGGMLGGCFNTLAAPHLFHSVAEYPLVVMAGCLVVRPAGAALSSWRASALPAIGVAFVTSAILVLARRYQLPLAVPLVALSCPALFVFSQRRDAARFGAGVAAMLAAGAMFSVADGQVLYSTRTFFGVYRVSEDPAHRYHGLAHGTTLHGMQALTADRRVEALTYYHSSGPFGDAWRALPGASRGRNIGVVGLGVGTLATYSTPLQRWTFFEIDPAIESIARTPGYFTFLDACGDRCRVVVGDARISLASTPQSFDLLVLDAFSSDSIPLHLMTREAMDLYVSRLAPGGAILMHVSNRHLRLAPVVGRLAADRGLYAARRVEYGGEPGWPEGKSGSDWIAMSRQPGDLTPLIASHGWAPLAVSPSVPLWTDDFSNILGVLDAR